MNKIIVKKRKSLCVQFVTTRFKFIMMINVLSISITFKIVLKMNVIRLFCIAHESLQFKINFKKFSTK